MKSMEWEGRGGRGGVELCARFGSGRGCGGGGGLTFDLSANSTAHKSQWGHTMTPPLVRPRSGGDDSSVNDKP